MPEQLLSGWGRATWSAAHIERPSSTEEAVEVAGSGVSLIARGLGRSYGDQATNAGATVVDMTDLNSPVPGPDETGRIVVPAGLSIDELLHRIVPWGWFVPVTPGTRHITIGGAIAADVHGKNHHRDGTFCEHVDELVLALPDGTTVRCSPNVDAELFWATAGGLGLTGIILEATIRLHAIETSRIVVDTTRLDTLDALLDAMVQADRTAPSSVAWIDLVTAAGRRSVLTTGRFAGVDDLPKRQQASPLSYAPRPRLAAPRWVPNGLLRHSTVRAFNEAWFRAAPKQRQGQLQSIARYYHPLDGVTGWNRIYGPQGFVQWQMVVPDGAEDTLRHCVDALADAPTPCFLAVLKRFGPANPGPLSFPLRGWTLAADMPAMSPGLAVLLDRLDQRVAEAGGRIYLAKDARLDPELVPVMYPRLDEWQAVRRRVDPEGLLRSDMARRLGL